MIGTAIIEQKSKVGAVMPVALVAAAGPPLTAAEVPVAPVVPSRVAEGDPPVAVVVFARTLFYNNQNKPPWSQISP
jgi:hypothetical protein